MKAAIPPTKAVPKELTSGRSAVKSKTYSKMIRSDHMLHLHPHLVG